eukprot:7899854-Pyramimonas_sp.AAC.2
MALLRNEVEDDGHRVTGAVRRQGWELGNVRRRRDDAAGAQPEISYLVYTLPPIYRATSFCRHLSEGWG